MRRRLVDSGIFVLLVATFFWGGNAVAGKLANGHVSPMLLTFFRWMIAAIILLPFAWKYLVEDWPVIRRNLAYFAIMAPLGFTLFNILLYTALTYTTAINVTIEQAAMPMFIFLINFIGFRTRPTWVQVLGYSVTLVGVVLTVSGASMARLRELDFNIGDLIMMLAAFCYAAYGVGLRLKPAMHWLSFLTVLILFAGIFSIPFVVYERSTDAYIFPTTALGWGIVAFAAIFPSIICQACFIRGNELLGANNAALFLNATPIFGALLSILILGEAFRWYHAVALVLVIGGITGAQHFGRVLSGK